MSRRVFGRGRRAGGRLAGAYERHFHGGRQERMFLSSLSFFATFATVRAITHAIRAGVGPLKNVTGPGGTHLHHDLWGILGLLGVGYSWAAEVGVGPRPRWSSRLTSLLFGAAAALTLDEFALWLHLEDVYWAKEGRQSVDAVVLFGGVLSAAVWGHPFLREAGALAAESAGLVRRRF